MDLPVGQLPFLWLVGLAIPLFDCIFDGHGLVFWSLDRTDGRAGSHA